MRLARHRAASSCATFQCVVARLPSRRPHGAEDECSGADGRDPVGPERQGPGGLDQITGDRVVRVEVCAYHQEGVGSKLRGGGVDRDPDPDGRGDVGAGR